MSGPPAVPSASTAVSHGRFAAPVLQPDRSRVPCRPPPSPDVLCDLDGRVPVDGRPVRRVWPYGSCAPSCAPFTVLDGRVWPWSPSTSCAPSCAGTGPPCPVPCSTAVPCAVLGSCAPSTAVPSRAGPRRPCSTCVAVLMLDGRPVLAVLAVSADVLDGRVPSRSPVIWPFWPCSSAGFDLPRPAPRPNGSNPHGHAAPTTSYFRHAQSSLGMLRQAQGPGKSLDWRFFRRFFVPGDFLNRRFFDRRSLSAD